MRRVLHPWLQAEFAWDESCVLVDEMVLPWVGVRADVGLVNHDLHGYEIKSTQDSLRRFPDQMTGYAQTFDFCTLVTQPRHVKAATAMLPAFWGLFVIDGGGVMETVRKPERNENVSRSTLASILWQAELAELLIRHGAPKKVRKGTRNSLVRLAAAELELTIIQNEVLTRLKSRTEYGSPQLLKEWRPPEPWRRSSGEAAPT